MKKLISVIPITMLILLLSTSISSYAVTCSSHGLYSTDGGNSWHMVWYNFDHYAYSDSNFANTNYFYYGYGQYGGSGYTYDFCMQKFAAEPTKESNGINGIENKTYSDGIIIIGIPYRRINNTNVQNFDTFDDYEDYINPPTPTPSPTPTPIPNMWDKFYEWYYNLYGYYPADDSLFGYFRSLFEEDAESSGSGGPSQHSISTHRPAPTPTTTPIPYSVSVVPVYDNNGNVTNYIYNYTYTSASGDTIVATSPPEQPTSNNTNEEPYNPDPLTVPTSSLDAWYMFAYDENEHPNPELQNPNDDFGTGMKYIEDNIDDYDRPIDYIMSVINAFPDDWLMLFGIGIGLIFIAGIISRFLS